MAVPVVKVESLSKKFILNHEAQEKYTTLRDTIAKRVKKLTGKSGNPNISKEEFWALNNISFEIEQGDRVGIIGRNGAGKSTLLKLLSRITEPTSGRISIRGRVASLLEVGTGFHPELSGRENIFLNGAILGMGRAEIRKKFDEIVAFAEVERFLDTPVKRYSSGMYVRLAFAVAAHLEPEILVVDEVLAVGDAQFQKKCLGKMEDVSKNEGRTVLFVSHNMGVISQLCKKAILLKGGSLVQYDDTRKVIDNYVLNIRENSNTYTGTDDTNQKSIYISKVETLNKNGDNREDFRFDENIILSIGIVVRKYDPATKISITLQNNNADYLSTFIEDLSSIYKGDDETKLLIKLPSEVIAPNTYAFRVAVFLQSGVVYDLVEMVCPLRVHDSGTKMALFEGVNYGSFFLNYEIVG